MNLIWPPMFAYHFWIVVDDIEPQTVVRLRDWGEVGSFHRDSLSRHADVVAYLGQPGFGERPGARRPAVLATTIGPGLWDPLRQVPSSEWVRIIQDTMTASTSRQPNCLRSGVMTRDIARATMRW